MKIVWVDDHEFLTVACCGYVQDHASEFCNEPIEVKPLFTLASAIQELKAGSLPDLLILDLGLSGQPTSLTIKQLREHDPRSVPVAICTALTLDQQGAVQTLRACMSDYQARGIILKGGDCSKMFLGLRRLLAGEIWMPDEVIRAFAKDPPPPKQGTVNAFNLTELELKVATYIAQGMSSRAIAEKVFKSDGHIRQVSMSIYRKLGVRRAGIGAKLPPLTESH